MCFDYQASVFFFLLHRLGLGDTNKQILWGAFGEPGRCLPAASAGAVLPFPLFTQDVGRCDKGHSP